LLPAIERPWEYYQNVVEHYVSAETPRLTTRSTVQLAASLKTDINGGAVLDDPAWPAHYRLSARQMGQVDKCHDPIGVGELMCDDIDLESLQQLIDDGLLICTNCELSAGTVLDDSHAGR
jgi:hypothetical protein